MNERKVKVARYGMIFTNGTEFGRIVYIADGVDENSWYEISEEEYEQYMKAREEEHRRMYGEIE